MGIHFAGDSSEVSSCRDSFPGFSAEALSEDSLVQGLISSRNEPSDVSEGAFRKMNLQTCVGAESAITLSRNELSDVSEGAFHEISFQIMREG